MTGQAVSWPLKGFLGLVEAETELQLLILVLVWEFQIPTCGQSNCEQMSVKVMIYYISSQARCERSYGKLSQLNPKQAHTLQERHGEGRIDNCAEPAWRCQSACAEHSGQNVLPVIVRRVWNQMNRARVVTESEKHGIHVPKFFC